MCTIDTIIVILKRKNLRQKDLTDYLGLSKNAFTNWKAGLNESWRKYLPQIADFLGVTVDELLGASGNVAHIPFTPPQQRVIDLVARLDAEDLLRVEGMLTMLLADDKYKKASAPQDA